MKQALQQIHKKIEQLQEELDGISLNRLHRIWLVESRIKKLETVRTILEKELEFDDRGSCEECGELGDGRTHKFIYCGYHGGLNENK